MSDLLEDNKAVVICSHRPALPTILESIASVASKDLSKQIISASDLRPAEMLVMHIAKGASKLQVVAVERWGIEPALEK
jgi:8-oxo-dGTP diphosphatase